MRLSRVLLAVIISMSIMLNANDKKVDINFKDLDMQSFIETISKITHKNILVDTKLRGKVNFITNEPIKKSSLIPLANSILSTHGLTLVDLGDFYKVVKSNDAAGAGLSVSDKITGDTMRTVIFTLKTANASILRGKIRPLLHKDAKVVSFKNNNMLSITAYPKTLRSIKKLIDSVEESSKKGSVFIKLKNASAKSVYSSANAMSKKLFPQSIVSEKVDVMKDEATNTIILVGKRENVNRMVNYVKKLDIEGEGTEQKMYVIPLKNSNVEEMEKILSKLIAQMNGAEVAKSKVKGKSTKPQKAMVVSDLERNALIVLATPEQIQNIKLTIAKIDIEKPQVFVKAKIVEINENIAKEVGVRYGFEGGKITSQGLFSLAGGMLGGSSMMVSQNLMSFLNTQSTSYDANGNAITNTDTPFKFSSDISEIFALGAKLDLLSQNGGAQVLSEPSILCTNNKEASIYVGQTQSILTSSSKGNNAQDLTRNSYSREDIGITLKVKPRLSSNNKVSLSVEAVIEDILGSSGSLSDRPTTTKRKVLTNAIVNNGETIIVGGLIKKSTGKATTKIPLLGDIPIIGELFKSNSNATSSVNVVIYLTPYIVPRSGDLKKLRKLLVELDGLQTKYNSIVYHTLENKRDANTHGASSRIIGNSTTRTNNHKNYSKHPASSRILSHDDEEENGIFIPGQ
ncbi:General secretion pathway protein D / Type II secretion outermembrane pore forming protein (PulD) [hydrothermal vent metagenome]|uniref:General secretion pathway protein D / Type II secretion outermembrane pore forming protein (PulD) n=1 Tax=hydrothermal vent metagenome TaxID=652676 RepID=A0A1W1EJH0_9ZZZZ